MYEPHSQNWECHIFIKQIRRHSFDFDFADSIIEVLIKIKVNERNYISQNEPLI